MCPRTIAGLLPGAGPFSLYGMSHACTGAVPLYHTMCLLPGVPAYVVLLVHWLSPLARCATCCVTTFRKYLDSVYHRICGYYVT